MLLVSWLWALVMGQPSEQRRPDEQRFAQREADLRRRFERLAHEVDVVQRAQTDEESRS